MIDGFTEAQVIGGLVGFIGALLVLLIASYAAFFGWLVSSIARLDRKVDHKIDAFDAKLSPKIDALTMAVSRLEGAVYHGLPEPRRALSEG
jgi:cobalamin biosynthesis protein CobD/CbiB